MIAILAKNFGWEEEKIKWMPFYKLLLFLHALNSYEGSNTRWRAAGSEIKLKEEELNNFLDEL